MSDEPIEYHFQVIKRQLAALQSKDTADWALIDTALEDLRVAYEHMQTTLEMIESVQEELLQQKQYYQNLFQFFPIPSLITDANGLIVEANQASAHLLNVSPVYLVDKPLAVFVTENDRAAFRTYLNQLPQSTGIRIWRTSLCPRHGEPVAAELHVAIVHNTAGQIENLRIAVYNLSQSQQAIEPSQPKRLEQVSAGTLPVSQLPASLDGLRVLVVDDEADVCELIIALLTSYGIHARAAGSAAEALEELERFRPDVLLSDVRMPNGDGYSLIRQIRALEAGQERHLPAAAITAYLDEDREKALTAGFEAHLHKLAQPTELIEMVAALAQQSSGREPRF